MNKTRKINKKKNTHKGSRKQFYLIQKTLKNRLMYILIKIQKIQYQ